MPLKFHFIAIGGSVMHSLAIALKKAGHHVSGSDDSIYGITKENLEREGLLPDHVGWDVSRINPGIDTVVLGMHAKKDNPELLKAQELGIPVKSYPELIFDHSKNKQRIVIGGSHGKTSTAAMIIHVLNKMGREFDYVVGASPADGMPMVRLSEAPIIIIEGDEYPSSAIDHTPKFLKYQHHVGLINGIEWDHANVFPSKDEYDKLFESFANITPKAGSLAYNVEDGKVKKIGESEHEDVVKYPYSIPKHSIRSGITYLINGDKEYPLEVFGKHNLSNLAGAKIILERVGILEDDFYVHIQSFKGAKNRMQLICNGDSSSLYLDFAHSPSKVRAATSALATQHSDKKLIACVELHTFSSLNKTFLPEYKDSLVNADKAIVYYNPAVVENKKLEAISADEIRQYFNQKVEVATDPDEIVSLLTGETYSNTDFLFMSSGTFGGLDLNSLATKIC